MKAVIGNGESGIVERACRDALRGCFSPFRFPIPDSRFPALPTPHSRFPIPGSLR